MRLATITLAAALAAPLPAFAEGGDRMPAGGAFMSSYNRNPHAPYGPGTAFAAGGFGTPDASSTATVPRGGPHGRPVLSGGRAPRR